MSFKAPTFKPSDKTSYELDQQTVMNSWKGRITSAVDSLQEEEVVFVENLRTITAYVVKGKGNSWEKRDIWSGKVLEVCYFYLEPISEEDAKKIETGKLKKLNELILCEYKHK